MNVHHIHIDMYDRLSMYTEKHRVGIDLFFSGPIVIISN